MVERELRETIMPILAAARGGSYAGLATCVSCAAEFTLMMDWDDLDALAELEQGPSYVAAIDRLASSLRVAPKRELWRRIDGPHR